MSSRSLKDTGPVSGSIQDEDQANNDTVESPTTATPTVEASSYAHPNDATTTTTAGAEVGKEEGTAGSPGRTPFRAAPNEHDDDEEGASDDKDSSEAPQHQQRTEASPQPAQPTADDEGSSSPQPPRPAPAPKRASMATVRRSNYYGSPAAAAAAASSNPSPSYGPSHSASPAGTQGAAPVLKVVVIGPQNVGKTSLIAQLTKKEFHSASKATVGVECKEHVFPGVATLQLWDVAGQQRYGTLTKQYYRWSAAVIVVASVTDSDSLALALEWKRDVMEKIGCVAAKNTSAIAQEEAVVVTGRGGASSSPAVANNNTGRSASLARGNTAQVHSGGSAARQSPSTPVGQRGASSSTAQSPSAGGASTNTTNSSNAVVCPIFLFMNKTDLMKDATMTSAEYEAFSVENGFTELVFVSAKEHNKVSQAFQRVAQYVTDMQEANGGVTPGASGSSVNLNALRRSVRVQDPKAKKKDCCK